MNYDIAIIGGGIVGLATAKALTAQTRAKIVILEAEDQLAAHQTGHNSGVIHSGLYYKPGSLKALNCTSGREAMYRFCAEHGIKCDRCGKLVVATSEAELGPLAELERRGVANGLQGIKGLKGPELKDVEPHVAGIAGLHVPDTGIVDYVAVAEAYAGIIRAAGGEILLQHRVSMVRNRADGMTIGTSQGEISARHLINCAGLQSDRMARLCGTEPGVKIIPFRGEYYELVPAKHALVRNLIYPVPDPRFPFLGVHFTRMIKGGVEAGPNAVLAFKREGYTMGSFDGWDMAELLAYGGFWKMAAKYWRMGFDEFHRSFSKAAFVKALQKLLPEIQDADLVPAGAGVRAQAVDANGGMVDDFRIVEAAHMIHVLNAPSPAATASISIGENIAELAKKNFGFV